MPLSAWKRQLQHPAWPPRLGGRRGDLWLPSRRRATKTQVSQALFVPSATRWPVSGETEHRAQTTRTILKGLDSEIPSEDDAPGHALAWGDLWARAWESTAPSLRPVVRALTDFSSEPTPFSVMGKCLFGPPKPPPNFQTMAWGRLGDTAGLPRCAFIGAGSGETWFPASAENVVFGRAVSAEMSFVTECVSRKVF